MSTTEININTAARTRPSSRSSKRRALPLRWLAWVDGVVSRHFQNVTTALVQIWANKARAMLTTLGMIIAVTSTITVVSSVQGFGNYVTDMLRGFGTNLMFVVPHRPTGFEGRRMGRVFLDVDDVRAVVARCDKVRRISPLIFGGATLE